MSIKNDPHLPSIPFASVEHTGETIASEVAITPQTQSEESDTLQNDSHEMPHGASILETLHHYGIYPPQPQACRQIEEDIRVSEGYINANQQEQELLDSIIKGFKWHPQPHEIEALAHIIDSDFFINATPQERLQLLEICQALPLGRLDTVTPHQGSGVNTSLQALAILATRNDNGILPLADQDMQGNSLITTLHAMLTLPQDQVIERRIIRQSGQNIQEIVAGMLLEMADIGRVAQENVGTCTATCMQIMLIEENPAEYARICRELLHNTEIKTHLIYLERDEQSFRPSPYNYRTLTERMFQSAIMETASSRFDYRVTNRFESTLMGLSPSEEINRSPQTIMEFLSPFWKIISWIFVLPGILFSIWPAFYTKMTGLNDDEINGFCLSLFGRTFHKHGGDLSPIATSDETIDTILEMYPDGHIPYGGITFGMYWEAIEDSDDEADYFAGIEENRSKEGFVLHQLLLREVVITGAQEDGQDIGYVIIHNPWGSEDGVEVGDAFLQGPPNTTWYDPSKGYLQMDLITFKKLLVSALIPENVNLTEDESLLAIESIDA